MAAGQVAVLVGHHCQGLGFFQGLQKRESQNEDILFPAEEAEARVLDDGRVELVGDQDGMDARALNPAAQGVEVGE